MFPLIFSAFLICIIIYDFIFLEKSARRSLFVLSLLFFIAILICINPKPLIQLARFLNIGRGVDILTYFSIIILTREYFLNRAKRIYNDERYIRLVRNIALNNPIKIKNHF